MHIPRCLIQSGTLSSAVTFLTASLQLYLLQDDNYPLRVQVTHSQDYLISYRPCLMQPVAWLSVPRFSLQPVCYLPRHRCLTFIWEMPWEYLEVAAARRYTSAQTCIRQMDIGSPAMTTAVKFTPASSAADIQHQVLADD